MNEQTQTQLALLREVSDSLSAVAVRWWLFGGWAMDFHAGEVTRDHSDIEIFIRIEDAERVRQALSRAGLVAAASLYPDEAQPFLKDGQEIGCWFLTEDASGALATPGRWADWPWKAGSFDGAPLTLMGVEAAVMSLEGLLDLKLNFHKHPHGAPLRNKDIDDIEVLRGLMAERDD